MYHNKSIIPIILGFFMGFVFFGVQVSLDAVNNAVAPERPYKLCYINAAGPGKLEIVLLGKPVHLTLPVPEGKMYEHAHANFSRVEEKCSKIKEKGLKKLSSVVDDFQVEWDRLFIMAEEYRNRKLIYDERE